MKTFQQTIAVTLAILALTTVPAFADVKSGSKQPAGTDFNLGAEKLKPAVPDLIETELVFRICDNISDKRTCFGEGLQQIVDAND